MKLTFLGANQQVTGSRYCLEAGDARIVIDWGLVQEREFLSRNWEPSPVPPSEIDALLLTHAHIDHSGLLPRLVAEGYRGPIYATKPSVDLAEIMLRDSARIQTEDVAYKKRRHKKERRRGSFPEAPLYTEADAEATLPLFQGITYQQPVKINDAFSVTFHDAGHILGSAMLEVLASENGATRRVLFSGDIGQWGKPLMRDPSLFDEADYVVMESTYGDKDHPDGGDIASQLAKIVNETVSRGGNVVIPTFAVERAQELMYFISRLVHADRIPNIDIFLDSPMAVDVTAIFRRYRDWLDEDTARLIEADEPPLRFPGLKMAHTADASRAINKAKAPCIIMATSGMCTAGRIKHHLRLNIGRPESTVLFVGYQGRGTLGRQILEGNHEVRIHGRMHHVRARVAELFGFSGHGDRTDLLRWLSHLRQPPRHVFLTHGEKEVSKLLADQITAKLAWPVSVPAYRDAVELD